MDNKLLRLIEIIQEHYPEELLPVFKSHQRLSVDERLALLCKARDFHQGRSEALWRTAGRQRTAEERYASAQAELASFAFACLAGEAKEYAQSAVEAMVSLGRQGEAGLIAALCRRWGG